MLDHEHDRSCSDSVLHSVVMTTCGVSDWNDESAKNADRMFTLLHEVSHQLDAPDHYCYDRDETGLCSNPSCDICQFGYQQARACLMGRYYDISTLSDEAIYCDDCETVIRNHLAGHH